MFPTCRVSFSRWLVGVRRLGSCAAMKSGSTPFGLHFPFLPKRVVAGIFRLLQLKVRHLVRVVVRQSAGSRLPVPLSSCPKSPRGSRKSGQRVQIWARVSAPLVSLPMLTMKREVPGQAGQFSWVVPALPASVSEVQCELQFESSQ